MRSEEFQRRILELLEEAKHSKPQALGKGHKVVELEWWQKVQRLVDEARGEADEKKET